MGCNLQRINLMQYTEEQRALVLALPEELEEHSTRGHGIYGIESNLFTWKEEPYQRVSPYEWDCIVRIAFHKWIEEGQRNFMHYNYFSPIVSWQEIAGYLARIGAINIQ